MKTKIVKPKEPEKEIATEVLAESIVEISNGIRKILAGRLNNRALEILICEASGVGIREIRDVLSSLENLDKRFLKPAK